MLNTTFEGIVDTAGKKWKDIELASRAGDEKTFDWVARKAKADIDSLKAGRIARKLGAGYGTTTDVENATFKASDTVRKFADEHGGKVAAGVAAGLGALAIAKRFRKKKKEKKESGVVV